MVGNAFVLANLHLFYLYTEDFLELKELEFRVLPVAGYPKKCRATSVAKSVYVTANMDNQLV